MIQAQDLHYTFPGEVPALQGLDLTIQRGRSLAILGPNGAGKSTLFLHLNGTLRPARGRVLLQGQPVGYTRRDLTAWRSRVALVLQDPDDQLFAATVAEDVSFGPLNLGLSEAQARARVAEALEALGLTDLAHRPTHMLSGGQKKRAAIAGAVAMHPDVLLLDEPTAGLDLAASEQLMAHLRHLAAKGMTLVFSTHDIELAWTLADEVALFKDGRVTGQGPAEALLTDAAALAQVGLRPPVLVDLWLAARDLGLKTEAPPRDAAAFRAMMAGWGQPTR
ncbi:ATP-binding cassette domain-containing protein [Rhodobacter sp. KR11]|uniref:energy-coupling factor ABC transporter ATP-binding protein n=1 Tax=Rhodobacter sp. KR11 TaxID=2974588 RepID=UPI00222385BC|nr:ATP-binding cassette domain-containing protein [Rhodobacter sp. KR11]MCW1920359.1 ATP-binding cassette domain-containing protein [Rhodobacter sp. KR11]